MSIQQHVETHLGPVEVAWECWVRGREDQRFHVARFAEQPMSSVLTHVTLGLGPHTHVPSGLPLGQELVFSCRERFAGWGIPALLGAVASEALAGRAVLGRGAVLGPAGPLFERSTLSALYCLPPVYFPDSFHALEGCDPAVQLVWLLPITTAEARFVREQGWKRFENLLARHAPEPDLFDLQRPGLPGT